MINLKRIILISTIFVFSSFTSYEKQLLTKECVYEYIVECKIKHPDIVYKQALLETGYLTSYNYRKRNNLFGFRHPKYVTNTNKYGYFIFSDPYESVRYYKLWQDKKYKGGNYYLFLKTVGYAEDSLYIYKLKKLKLEGYK